MNATFELSFFSGWTVCPETAVVRYPKKPGVSLQDFFNSIPDDVGKDSSSSSSSVVCWNKHSIDYC